MRDDWTNDEWRGFGPQTTHVPIFRDDDYPDIFAAANVGDIPAAAQPTNPKTEADLDRMESDLLKLKVHFPVFADHHWSDIEQVLSLFRKPPGGFNWDPDAMLEIFGDPSTWETNSSFQSELEGGSSSTDFFKLG